MQVEGLIERKPARRASKHDGPINIEEGLIVGLAIAGAECDRRRLDRLSHPLDR
jgi:hypothetical protein